MLRFSQLTRNTKLKSKMENAPREPVSSPQRQPLNGPHRVRVGFSEGSNFYKIRPIFKGEQLLQNKDFDCRRQLLQKIQKIEENWAVFSKFSSDFSNFYKIRVGPGTKSNFYKISRNFALGQLLQNKARNEQLLPKVHPMRSTDFYTVCSL